MTWPLSRYQGAGRSAEREYKRLKKAWRRRIFGRFDRYFWPALFITVIAATIIPKPGSTVALVFLGGCALVWWVVRDTPPDHIARWQRGAWGEQLTAKMLRPLSSEGWTVRHDLDTGHGNRDHVLVGPAVYLLDTKFHTGDRLSLEGSSLRVQRVDQPRDSYLLDHITGSMARAAKVLSAEIRRDTGERVFVYPVVVLWGYFDAKVQEVEGVYYIDGDELAGWLRRRPTDLYNRRRATVSEWLPAWKPRVRAARGSGSAGAAPTHTLTDEARL